MFDPLRLVTSQQLAEYLSISIADVDSALLREVQFFLNGFIPLHTTGYFGRFFTTSMYFDSVTAYLGQLLLNDVSYPRDYFSYTVLTDLDSSVRYYVTSSGLGQNPNGHTLFLDTTDTPSSNSVYMITQEAFVPFVGLARFIDDRWVKGFPTYILDIVAKQYRYFQNSSLFRDSPQKVGTQSLDKTKYSIWYLSESPDLHASLHPEVYNILRKQGILYV